MLLARVAEVSREVAATSARSRKIRLLAELFAEAEPEESPLVIAYLSGRLPQGRIGVGWSVLKEVVPPAVPPVERPGLTLGRVDAVMTGSRRSPAAGSVPSGPGSSTPSSPRPPTTSSSSCCGCSPGRCARERSTPSRWKASPRPPPCPPPSCGVP